MDTYLLVFQFSLTSLFLSYSLFDCFTLFVMSSLGLLLDLVIFMLHVPYILPPLPFLLPVHLQLPSVVAFKYEKQY